MHGAGAGSHGHESGGGGRQPYGEDHLPGGISRPESIRHPGEAQVVRGSSESQGGERSATAEGPGTEIYRQFLPYCDTAYVTKVDYRYDADTFFPNLDESSEWEMTHDSEEQTYYDLEYYFTIYQRKG